ncbi:MAG: hypothetical protein WDN49_10415 [Acetobacteraceae bacterium]
MADEQDYPGDLRIPIGMTVRWPGKVTLGGMPWPLDRQGRYWPEDRRGDPLLPLDEYPPGVRAPGTGAPPMTTGDAARSYLAVRDAQASAIATYASRPIPTYTITSDGDAAAPGHPGLRFMVVHRVARRVTGTTRWRRGWRAWG